MKKKITEEGEGSEEYNLLKEELRHLKELVDERFKALEKALQLQALEYGRRLENLNHEAARIQASQDKSISVDKFDGFERQIHTELVQGLNTITGKFDEASKTHSNKIEAITISITDKMEQMKKTLEEKRDLAIGALNDRFESNLKRESEKFKYSDQQMQLLVNSNAETSNRLIGELAKRVNELFASKERQEGVISAIKWILSALATILIALIITFLSKYL